MTSPVDAPILRVARAVARDLAARGARAVVLTGSHARGDAHAHSDIDLMAIVPRRPSGEDRRTWLRPVRVIGGQLVTVAWETEASARATFRNPERATTFVPGWREAIALHDPDGFAARIKRRAEAWTWREIAAAADAHVANGITGLAEEVHKLAGMLATGNRHAAAAQRSILAVWLAGLVALRHRILFGTDNALWELVAERMSEPWASTQAAALSENGEALEASCAAALRLYALAAAEARPLLDRGQRAVVDAACEIARTHSIATPPLVR